MYVQQLPPWCDVNRTLCRHFVAYLPDHQVDINVINLWIIPSITGCSTAMATLMHLTQVAIITNFSLSRGYTETSIQPRLLPAPLRNMNKRLTWPYLCWCLLIRSCIHPKQKSSGSGLWATVLPWELSPRCRSPPPSWIPLPTWCRCRKLQRWGKSAWITLSLVRSGLNKPTMLSVSSSAYQRGNVFLKCWW